MFRMLRCLPIFPLISVLCVAQSPVNNSASSNTPSSQSTPITSFTSSKPNLLTEAIGLYREGSFPGAITKYKALLEEKPTSPDGWAGLIRSYLKMEDFEAASQSAEQALASSDHPRIRTAHAEVLFRKGEIAEAEKEWVGVVNSGFPEARAYLGLAKVRAANTMYHSAKKMIDEAHKLSPNDPDITELWLKTLPRTERIERLKSFLVEEPGLDASERANISEYLDFLVGWQNDHGCRLISKVTETEAPLIGMWNGRHALRGYGLSVELNGHANVLLLDTGASGILVGRRVAEQAKITNVMRTTLRGIGGLGSTGGSVGFAESIKIGEMEFQNCPIRVTDSDLVGVDGLIGTDVLGKFLVDIDFPEERLKLSELPKRPGQLGGELTLSAQSNEELNDQQEGDIALEDRYIAPEMQSFTHVYCFGHYLLVATSIGEVPPKLFLLDSGSFTNTISPSAASEVTKVYRAPNIIVEGIAGDEREVFTASKAILRFGHFSQKNQQMIGFDTSSMSQSAGTEISGLLGFSTLRMLDIKIDYRDGLVNFSYDANKWREMKHHHR